MPTVTSTTTMQERGARMRAPSTARLSEAHERHQRRAPLRLATFEDSPATFQDRAAAVLRCVSSGYLADGCSCRATVPAGIATAAWALELQQAPAREDRFFRFAWAGGEWLAYGLRDGRVRGVYCPEHSAARAARCSGEAIGAAS